MFDLSLRDLASIRDYGLTGGEGGTVGRGIAKNLPVPPISPRSVIRYHFVG